MSSKDQKRIVSMLESTKARIEASQKPTEVETWIKNITAYRDLTEEQRDDLLEVASTRLRTLDSGRANRVLGPKGDVATAFVARVYAAAAAIYDLSDNATKAGPKVGGLEKFEGHFLNRYISYRNPQGLNLGLSWTEKTPDSPRELYINLRQVTGQEKRQLWIKYFEGEAAAEAAYLTHLAGLARLR